MARFLLLLSILTSSIKLRDCFSTGKDFDLTSFARSGEDATTLSPTLFDHIKSCHGPMHDDCSITYLSDFKSFNTIRSKFDSITLEEYCTYTSDRHRDCIDLFNRYESKLLRFERINSISTPRSSVVEFNIRWQASWVTQSSLWLFDLSDALGWEVKKKVLDYSQITAFSWKKVGLVFQQAFQTGTITLPVSIVEGNSRLRFKLSSGEDKTVRIVSMSITESIDLIREADLGRLQNRIVGQELASWLDVSRRPSQIDSSEWAATVRDRVLTGVPGAGPLDVDPNEDGPEVLFVFSAICIVAFALLYKVLFEEIFGSTGEVSKLCDDAARIEIGSGYFSECFGPFGDGPFL